MTLRRKKAAPPGGTVKLTAGRAVTEVGRGVLSGAASVPAMFVAHPLAAPAIMASLAGAAVASPAANTFFLWGGLSVSLATVAKNAVETSAAARRGDPAETTKQLRELGESFFGAGLSFLGIGLDHGLAFVEGSGGPQAAPGLIQKAANSIVAVIDWVPPIARLLRGLRRRNLGA